MMTPLEKLRRTWFWVAAGLVAVLAPYVVLGDMKGLTDRFLVSQDAPVLIVMALAAVFWPLVRGPAGRLAPVIDGGIGAIPARPIVAVAAIAVVCLVVTWAGTVWIYDGYALSMDEFMANFDAVIFSHGSPMAAIPAPWRPFSGALQPIFTVTAAGRAAWSSAYLPVNAALRALGGMVGARSLVSPLLAAVSVVAVFAVARRLWPRRPDLAVIAALLLATSSQFLVTAMTAYAMTAHLAFNLVWLWLFLRGGKAGHLGAIAVGFLACGLHQLAFHPLFVAPFVLQLIFERRWRLAALYVAAYAAICLFWVSYWPLVFATMGPAHPAAGAVGARGGSFWTLALAMLRNFNGSAIRLTAENLIRFVTWQSLLTVPLAVLGAVAAIRARGTPRSLALGFFTTGLAMFFIMPYQGHGWGYRYWHGLLGSACLLAAFAWGRLTDPLAGQEKAAARAGFAVLTAASALILSPVRALQVHAFEHPYALAEAAIQASPAQVVLIDDRAAWYTIDLARNDPYLTNRPLEMGLRYLSLPQVRALCARYTVALFDGADARRFGILGDALSDDDDVAEVRLAALRGASCGAPAAPVGEIRP